MIRLRNIRRSRGLNVLGLGTFVLGVVVVPALHLIGHSIGPLRATRSAPNVADTALELYAHLSRHSHHHAAEPHSHDHEAEAHSHQDAAEPHSHSHSHDDAPLASVPIAGRHEHSHSPGDGSPNTPGHGRGSLEHLAFAASATATFTLVVVSSPASVISETELVSVPRLPLVLGGLGSRAPPA